MDHHQRALRAGAAVLLFAISLRLFGGGIFQPLKPPVPTNLLSFLLYLQTGRIVRLPRPTQPPTPTQTVAPPTTGPQETQPPVVFTANHSARPCGVTVSPALELATSRVPVLVRTVPEYEYSRA